MSVVASIGTTHPWNIAGTGLDALVCRELGIRHCAVVAAISAQDASGLHGLQATDPDLLRAQLRALPKEIDTYCVGALGGPAAIAIVTEYVAAREGATFVVDPVFRATLGGTFATKDAIAAFASTLARESVILTPNLAEASQLLACDIADTQRETAAVHLLQRGPRAVLLTGGDRAGDAIDVLALPGSVRRYEAPRIGVSMRGSGGVLAAALACELALGANIESAVTSARAYVRDKIASARTFAGLQVAF